jgi:hypothetical protein
MAAEVGPWTDLYSLGVIVFEMLVGRTPFYDSDTPMSIVLRHVNEAIPAVSDLRPDVDPAVSDWVGRLLVKDPSQRTQSAADAWDEFEDLAIGILGARWRDGSALVGMPPAADTAAWPQTRTTRGLSSGRGRRTATTNALARAAPPLDAPLGDTAMATAMPPREERDSPRARRRTPLAVLATVTLLAVVAGAAAFAGGGRDGGGPATTASTATSSPAAFSSSPSTPSSATGAAGSAQPVLDALRRSSAPDEAAFASASGSSEQSHVAGVLATDYEDAADQLPSGSDPRLGDALRQIAAAYRAAATAAESGDDSGFKAAGAAVDAGQQALDDALAGAPNSSPAPAPNSSPAPAPQPPPASSSSGSGSTGSSGGSGGSGGANENENEPDENDNGD